MLKNYYKDSEYIMRNKGRIFTIISALIVYFFVYYFIYKRIAIPFNIYHMGHVVSISIGAYLFGMHYDRVKYYNKQLKEEKEKLDKNIEELKYTKEELQLIFDNVNAAIFSVDLEKNTYRVSKGISKLYGLSSEELEKNPDLFKEFIYHEDKEILIRAQQKLLSEKTGIIQQYRIVNRSGEVLWVEESITPLIDSGGKVLRLNGVILDITKRKDMENTIRHMAYHDSLTGLPNRPMLKEYLDKALARLKRSKGQLAIMFLDLDHFKAVNDMMGHGSGDLLLKYTAELLRGAVRDGDTVSRYGGDEFIILLEDVVEGEAIRIAERILDEFRTPFQLNMEELIISPSIGISFYPQHGDDGQTLIKNADEAMYIAKKSGKNNYKLYTKFQ